MHRSGSSPRTRTSTSHSPRDASFSPTQTAASPSTLPRARARTARPCNGFACGPTPFRTPSQEIRAILRDRGRAGAEWELGESCTPVDLVSRLCPARHRARCGRARGDRHGARCRGRADGTTRRSLRVPSPRSTSSSGSPNPERGIRRRCRRGRARASRSRLRSGRCGRFDIPRIHRRHADRGRVRLVHPARAAPVRRRHAPLSPRPRRVPRARGRQGTRGRASAVRRCSSPTPARCPDRSSSASGSRPWHGSTGCSTCSSRDDTSAP